MPWSADDISRMTGRVAVVTGGTSGVGLATVRELCRHRAHVIIGSRDATVATRVKAQVEQELPEASIEYQQLDLASKASISDFAVQVGARHAAIDVLFNNAGVLATPQSTTEDGFELQYGTNHLGHFYLTYRLLPLVLQKEHGRIANTTSSARRLVRAGSVADRHSRLRYDPWQAYAISKKANLLFAIELNRRLVAAGATARVSAADPGFARTKMQATAPSRHRWLTRPVSKAIVQLIGHSPANAALPQLRATTDADDAGGMLYRPRFYSSGPPVAKEVRLSDEDESELVDLWHDSERDLGITFDVEAMVAASR